MEAAYHGIDNIIVSLQRLVRKTSANSQIWNSKYHKRWYYLAAHRHNVTVLRSNIIFLWYLLF